MTLQAVDPGDRGGTTCWMGQNYANQPWIHDSDLGYTNDPPDGDYKLWVPDDFPRCTSNAGRYHSTRIASPVRWVAWSMGPRPTSDKLQDSRVPIANRGWYRRAGAGGVIARMATRDGMQLKTP